MLNKQTSYSDARANLASLMQNVTSNHETIIITRRNKENVAMIAESELSSLLETAHLLRSPKNAERLLKALERAQTDNIKPKTIDALYKDAGLEKEQL